MVLPPVEVPAVQAGAVVPPQAAVQVARAGVAVLPPVEARAAQAGVAVLPVEAQAPPVVAQAVPNGNFACIVITKCYLKMQAKYNEK